ncbi:hypothetical protein FACS1894164_14200 [Spirochaetia bacterium]|nr:hypothetical protein FACS1894164_14200 [Spirochaetia bacterium]
MRVKNYSELKYSEMENKNNYFNQKQMELNKSIVENIVKIIIEINKLKDNDKMN